MRATPEDASLLHHKTWVARRRKETEILRGNHPRRLRHLRLPQRCHGDGEGTCGLIGERAPPDYIVCVALSPEIAPAR
jgi:hypothetical protein